MGEWAVGLWMGGRAVGQSSGCMVGWPVGRSGGRRTVRGVVVRWVIHQINQLYVCPTGPADWRDSQGRWGGICRVYRGDEVVEEKEEKEKEADVT